ncbi:MAG TPA: DNA replication/repair protein RecF [Stellaceae bacterium]|nr:DNA replication/repair protein RecF [Stellaceae bacterium]
MALDPGPLAESGVDPHIEGHGERHRAQAMVGRTRPTALTRLHLTDFRGYAAARLEVESRPVVLTGPNGAGKTNLLEAISFLAPGRGLRRARLAEIDRRVPPAKPTDRPPGAWAVGARLLGPRGAVQVGTGRDAASPGGERRLVRIDGVRAKSQAALAEHAHITWLTPQMDRLFGDGSGERRRFLDRLVLGFDAAHAARVAAYERAMRERARLLRDGPADPAWLGALEATMAAEGIAIAAARHELTLRLDAECAAAPGPFPQARLRLAGEVEDWLAAMPALAAEDTLRRRLAAGRRADAESGITLTGPHRADLAVHHVASGMAAASCSTGEQKALLIAILLAHARLRTRMSGAPPILLLDEVAAHLDPTRRAALFDALTALETQAWLTGTEPQLFAGLAGLGQFVTVADAAIGL